MMTLPNRVVTLPEQMSKVGASRRPIKRVGRDSRNFRQKRPNSMIQRKNLNYQSVGLGNVQPAVTVVVPAPSV